MFARYAKEYFDSDSLERKQYVLKALGAELKLSGRTIIFSPVKYLISIEKAVKSIEANNDLVRACPQQSKKDPEGSDLTSWCRIVNEVRTLIEEDLVSDNKIRFTYNPAFL